MDRIDDIDNRLKKLEDLHTNAFKILGVLCILLGSYYIISRY